MTRQQKLVVAGVALLAALVLWIAWPSPYARVANLRSRGTSIIAFGDSLTLRAADRQEGSSDALEVLLLGGLPIREPIAHYGPFVMNTREEIGEAIADYHAGRLGIVPADQAAPRRYS